MREFVIYTKGRVYSSKEMRKEAQETVDYVMNMIDMEKGRYSEDYKKYPVALSPEEARTKYPGYILIATDKGVIPVQDEDHINKVLGVPARMLGSLEDRPSLTADQKEKLLKYWTKQRLEELFLKTGVKFKDSEKEKPT